jgi:nicotinamide-nucleotide amidase
MTMHAIPQLAQQVGAALHARQAILSTAESCTGGGIAYAITEIAGSSAWFDRGFVTYSNVAKQDMLSIPMDIINKHGAVSEEVAAAMVEGAIKNSTATITVSTTGIAGPGGAVPGKPVGTVCFGWKIDGRVIVERQQFTGDRQAVRLQSIAYALQKLLQLLA